MMFWWKKPKFKEVAKKALELKKLKSPATFAQAEIHFAKLISHFGSMPIARIDEAAWAAYIESERQKKARKFWDDRKHMRTVLIYAHREGFIKRQIRLPIPDLPWKAGREISMDELRKLHRHASSELQFQIAIAWQMGLRKSEMLRLEWDRFDWDRKLIILFPEDTKTRLGREVAINESLIIPFQTRFVSRRSRYVFPNPKDLNRPQANNKTAWKICCRKAGIKARWHDLRHTCATLLLRKGVSIEIACRYLGMSPKVLRRIYFHINTDDLRKAASALRERI